VLPDSLLSAEGGFLCSSRSWKEEALANEGKSPTSLLPGCFPLQESMTIWFAIAPILADDLADAPVEVPAIRCIVCLPNLASNLGKEGRSPQCFDALDLLLADLPMILRTVLLTNPCPLWFVCLLPGSGFCSLEGIVRFLYCSLMRNCFQAVYHTNRQGSTYGCRAVVELGSPSRLFYYYLMGYLDFLYALGYTIYSPQQHHSSGRSPSHRAGITGLGSTFHEQVPTCRAV
jgi:hypothetical protein